MVAGAFAAFLSTTSGLVVSLAGVISQDVLGGSVRGFRLAAVISAVVPLGFAFMTDSLALAGSVGLVFAFTASTVCPVLLLGIWWRGLTDAGAIAGMADRRGPVRRGNGRGRPGRCSQHARRGWPSRQRGRFPRRSP